MVTTLEATLTSDLHRTTQRLLRICHQVFSGGDNETVSQNRECLSDVYNQIFSHFATFAVTSIRSQFCRIVTMWHATSKCCREICACASMVIQASARCFILDYSMGSLHIVITSIQALFCGLISCRWLICTTAATIIQTIVSNTSLQQHTPHFSSNGNLGSGPSCLCN